MPPVPLPALPPREAGDLHTGGGIFNSTHRHILTLRHRKLRGGLWSTKESDPEAIRLLGIQPQRHPTSSRIGVTTIRSRSVSAVPTRELSSRLSCTTQGHWGSLWSWCMGFGIKDLRMRSGGYLIRDAACICHMWLWGTWTRTQLSRGDRGAYLIRRECRQCWLRQEACIKCNEYRRRVVKPTETG